MAAVGTLHCAGFLRPHRCRDQLESLRFLTVDDADEQNGIDMPLTGPENTGVEKHPDQEAYP